MTSPKSNWIDWKALHYELNAKKPHDARMIDENTKDMRLFQLCSIIDHASMGLSRLMNHLTNQARTYHPWVNRDLADYALRCWLHFTGQYIINNGLYFLTDEHLKDPPSRLDRGEIKGFFTGKTTPDYQSLAWVLWSLSIQPNTIANAYDLRSHAERGPITTDHHPDYDTDPFDVMNAKDKDKTDTLV